MPSTCPGTPGGGGGAGGEGGAGGADGGSMPPGTRVKRATAVICVRPATVFSMEHDHVPVRTFSTKLYCMSQSQS
jgi:hypothetical protein